MRLILRQILHAEAIQQSFDAFLELSPSLQAAVVHWCQSVFVPAPRGRVCAYVAKHDAADDGLPYVEEREFAAGMYFSGLDFAPGEKSVLLARPRFRRTSAPLAGLPTTSPRRETIALAPPADQLAFMALVASARAGQERAA